MTGPNDILTFWFGDDRTIVRSDWFKGGPAFDEKCRAFLPAWKKARDGSLDAWREAPDSLLAFVVLTDQIPRNCFREDDRAFASDDIALAAARQAVAAGWDRDMTKLERVFLYLPFEHAEDMAMQNESIRLYTALGDAEYLKFAEAHRVIVERFGRFPHRNALLGRANTPEETAFLEEHGRGF